ncbi:MAG TPA: response regulator [Vicinamibacteria bacterium]|nr:response regulator [Vicinamibacteria bacterium]
MAGERILVVDDEPALRELLGEVLAEAGYRVSTAGDGHEAMEALERVAPELVISDISMPGMDGYRLYAEVRARPRWVNVPFLFLSGHGSEADVRAGRQLGVDDYLTKPVHEADLLIAVRARLDRRAQLEAAHAEQLEMLKQSILETLNHEFRTPLTVLVGYGQMLRDFGPQLTQERLRPLVQGILTGCARLQRLVEDLVLLVDLDSGAARRAYEKERTVVRDLPELLADVADEWRPRAEGRGVQVAVEAPSSLPPVRAQRALLATAVGRLVDNAIKFSKPGGGRVTVSAGAAEEVLRVEVRDTGIGIAADHVERITGLFYQAGRERLEQQGCGTGLTVAQGIVALHGGRLAVDSTPGVGSAFTIELPVFRPEA